MLKLSIIIPVYNVENYLIRCIESIFIQNKNDFREFEIILVDDGSTDASGKLCDELSNKFNNIKVFHKINGGLSEARNFGITKAKGKYICFMDSDDYLIDDLFYVFEKGCKEYPNFDILQYGYEVVRDASQNTTRCSSEFECFNNLTAYKEYINGGKIKRAAWNKFYLKELFDSVAFPIGRLAEDYGTTYKVLNKSRLVIVTPYKVYGYFQRSDSIMGSKSLKLIIDEYHMGCNFFEFSIVNYHVLHNLIYSEHANLLLKSYSRIVFHKDYKNNKSTCTRILNEIKENISFYSFEKISFKSKLMLCLFRISPIIPSIILNLRDKIRW